MSLWPGVYQHISGAALGGHAMKLIGWGTENGTDYWLIANSWNTTWGISGFLKFLRGTNHLGIEDYLVTATPQLTSGPATVPPCGDNAASRAYCQGKWRYAIAPENVCSNQFCCCPGTCTSTAFPPWVATCPAGTYMDPTPSVYSDSCVDPSTIPACSPAAVTTQRATSVTTVTPTTKLVSCGLVELV